METKQKLFSLCRQYEIADLYVFGSRSLEIAEFLDGRHVLFPQAESDVDVGILPMYMNDWAPEKKVRFAMELEDFFNVGRIDLVLLPEADAFLALEIIRGELLFTCNPDSQAEHELFVLRRAGDLLPFRKSRNKKILEEGAR